MLRFSSFLLISGLMLVLACALVKPGAHLAEVGEEIRTPMNDMIAAYNRRDLEAFISFMAPDAIIQLEASPAITGTATIRAMIEKTFESPFKEMLWESQTIVLATKCKLAYVISAFKIVFEGRDGRMEVPGKSTIIWRKTDGHWKAAVWNFSVDVPGAPWTQ